MAVSKKPSKFQFVQSFFAKNQDATADAAVDAASKKGLDISVKYARQIRSKSKGKLPKKTQRKKSVKKSKATRRKQASPTRAPSTQQEKPADIEQALEAVRFIRRIGDITTARKAIDAAENIMQEVRGID